MLTLFILHLVFIFSLCISMMKKESKSWLLCVKKEKQLKNQEKHIFL